MKRIVPNLPRLRAILALVCAGATVGGCTVGPNFLAPVPPVATDYTATALPRQIASAQEGGPAQRLASGRDIPAQWWQLFHSPALDQLIRQALTDSPTLAAAEATLRQARENLHARSGREYYPSVDASLSGSRQKVSGSAFGQPGADGFLYGLYNATVNVSYSLDLFGGGRRELEALRAEVDYQRFQLEGAYLTLTANIVTTAVKEASLRAQIKTTQEILALQGEQLRVVERQFQLGAGALADVLTQRTQLAQTSATLPPLEKELARTRNQLAVYVGRLPSEASLPEFALENLQLPDELPLSLPSLLVRQRPDIRAAEELLHAASAQVGVATANLYPQITLNASLGSQSNRLEDLLASGTSVWSLGAGLLQPVFRGGELTAKRRAAIAAFDQAVAQYRLIILQAFLNVADVLQALDSDARTLSAQATAEQAARETLELVRQQFQFGAVNYLALLNAQRQQQQTRISLVQAQAARFADSAALFQALGGGWWNREADTNGPATATK